MLKREHFYVLESSIVIVGLSRNRTPFTFVDHLGKINIYKGKINIYKVIIIF